ncbi:MAG TPA: NUDIX domain-containing protein [Galbitalea sp.]|jgi:predicted NUDIX family NTP pyrophosphohydrolase|nr:NUDIX domain-containing protein [Galbitalea sp.]
MPVRSAGILLWRHSPGSGELEVFIAHMGGPFWAKKDAAAWSIPKGEYVDGEEALAAALREFGEEIGVPAPTLDYADLGEFRQSSGKLVAAFAAESDFELAELKSNTFTAEWPPRSGRIREFPEVDRAEWSGMELARARLVPGQLPILDALENLIG